MIISAKIIWIVWVNFREEASSGSTKPRVNLPEEIKYFKLRLPDYQKHDKNYRYLFNIYDNLWTVNRRQIKKTGEKGINSI